MDRDPRNPQATAHRSPHTCPVCGEQLQITQLGCANCGTGLSGHFQPCEFCSLDDAQRELLRLFLVSRGNMKELERHLKVSYPTARARLDEVLHAIGIQPPAAPGPAARSDDATEQDSRLGILQALASGESDVDTAARLLDHGK